VLGRDIFEESHQVESDEPGGETAVPDSLASPQGTRADVRLVPSGTRVALTEMAPASIFRCGGPGDVEGGDETAQDEEAGRGEGDGVMLRGRVHVARQDLGGLQTRKMKGLKPRLDEEEPLPKKARR
jgi:hypothetical protein